MDPSGRSAKKALPQALPTKISRLLFYIPQFINYLWLKGKVFIFDTTLRDGEQVPGCKLNTKEKLRSSPLDSRTLAWILSKPASISSPGDFESVNQIARTIKNATVCGLSRAGHRDIEVAAEALRHAPAAGFIPGSALPISTLNRNSTPPRKISWKEPFNA